MNENVRYREIIREDGQPGYMIKIKGKDKQYLLIFHVVIGCFLKI